MRAESASDVDRSQRLDEVLFAYLKAAEAGPALDRGEWLARHAEFAAELAEFFADLDGVDRLAHPLRAVAAAAHTLPHVSSGTLGDFRLLREVGRGGMGVVYEAEQVSLNRRVALKVLPFAATMDPRQLQRFRYEAQAAAMLHHPNVVPVHGVGCERGVHYYAMQLIEGQSLAAVIEDLRGDGRAGSRERSERGRVSAPSSSKPDLGALTRPRSPETAPVAALSTKATRPDKAHYRRSAELIAQAADALEYAHSMGVVHRDVNPANLMLDEAGHLWVTDFGLARLGDGAGLTVSGDLLGTLRYMSPEQALAKHGLVDHRTDVYSLGATLYELLTLQPAVGGESKQEVLKHIAFEEPIRPRKLDKAIPAELETVTLKALAKNPAERYATAGELADDLRRWLGHQTIKAKPPTVRQQVAKWSRRHVAAVLAAGIASSVIVAALAGMAGWSLGEWRQRQAETARAVNAAMDESKRLQDQLKPGEALLQVQQASAILASGASTPALQQRVRERLDDLTFVLELEGIRADWGTTDGAFTPDVLGQTDRRFAAAFRRFGIDFDSLPPDEAALRLRQRTVAVEVAAVLDAWASLARMLKVDKPRWQRLLAAARAIDPEPTRSQLREIVEREDTKALQALLTPSSSLNVPHYQPRVGRHVVPVTTRGYAVVCCPSVCQTGQAVSSGADGRRSASGVPRAG